MPWKRDPDPKRAARGDRTEPDNLRLLKRVFCDWIVPQTPDSAGHHNGLACEHNDVARHQLLPLSGFDDPVEEDEALAYRLLGLAAASGQSPEFEELAKFYGRFGNGHNTRRGGIWTGHVPEVKGRARGRRSFGLRSAPRSSSAASGVFSRNWRRLCYRRPTNRRQRCHGSWASDASVRSEGVSGCGNP